MKRFLAAAALAVGFGGTGAHAQTKSDMHCADNQVKVVSALALSQGGNGIVDCKEKTLTSPETHTTRASQRDMASEVSHVLLADASTVPVRSPSVAMDGKGNFVYNGNQFSITPFSSTHGTGLAGTVVLGGKDVAVGLKVDGTSKMKHGTLGVATRVGESATVSLTGAVAQEDAGIALGNKDYDGKTLKAEQIMLGLDGANVGSFKTAGISLGTGKAHATELGTSSVTTTENRDVDTSTATEHWRDTYSTKTTTNYTGSTWNRVGARGVVDVGAQGELSLRAGAYTNSIMGNKATGGVGYTHYMGTSGKVEVNADILGENKLYSAKYTKPLSEGWALTAGVSHLAGVINDTKAMVGLVWTPGSKSSYSRPTGYESLDANKVAQRNLSSAENNLQGLGAYGKVETTTGPKTLTGSEKTGETAKDPAPTVGGAFASLADMTVSDNLGDPISPINAGGVTDPLGRTIVYTAIGLPAGLSINSSTGVITGAYDSIVGLTGTESFTVTVKAQATGSTKSASKTFVLTVRDDG